MVEPGTLQRLGLQAVPDPFGADEPYDGVILAVPHQVFRERPFAASLRLLQGEGGPGVLVDVTGVWRDAARGAPILYWSL